MALKYRLQAFKFWAWSWLFPPALFDMAQRFVRRDRAANRTLSPPEHPTPLSSIMYPVRSKIYLERGPHWIPVEKIVNWYGQSFTTEQNHFVRYLESGFDDFERFFQIHQPKTAFQSRFIDETFPDPAGTGGSDVPWLTNHLADDKAANVPASVPVSYLKLGLAIEATRLDRIRHSIKKYGFLAGHAKPGGQIRYQIFLKDSDNFRICVLAGNHRTAVLAHLGWKLIPVHPLAGYHPVRLSDLADWPGVLDGRFTEETARAMFETFFRPVHQQLLPGW